MSLGIVVKSAEGLVLGAESRVTLTATDAAGEKTIVTFDNATKLLAFSPPNDAIGAVTYGAAAIGLRTPNSYIPEFESTLSSEERLSVKEFAGQLSAFMMKQWAIQYKGKYKGQAMVFQVAGFDDAEAYGKIYTFELPNKPDPVEVNPGEQFGISWGGQRELIDRIVQGYDHKVIGIIEKTIGLDDDKRKALLKELSKIQLQVPYQFLPLQDCVDLVIFFIRTTIDAQSLTVGLRGCGGSIDVATITRSGKFKFVQQKFIKAKQ